MKQNISSVQFSRSVMSDFLQPHGLQHTRPPSLSITNSWSLPKLRSIELVMPSNHLILCCSLLLKPSTFPSIRVFLIDSVIHISWPKYWRFGFSINPSNEYSRLISFRMDWMDWMDWIDWISFRMDLLAVQETLKSLLHTTVQKHQFFGAQLSL